MTNICMCCIGKMHVPTALLGPYCLTGWILGGKKYTIESYQQALGSCCEITSYIKLEIWWSYFEWCVKINCCKALSFTRCALIICYFSARASLLISFEQSPLLLTIELRNATSMIKCYIYIFSTITYYFSVVQHRSMWITMVALACSTLQWGLTTS